MSNIIRKTTTVEEDLVLEDGMYVLDSTTTFKEWVRNTLDKTNSFFMGLSTEEQADLVYGLDSCFEERPEEEDFETEEEYTKALEDFVSHHSFLYDPEVVTDSICCDRYAYFTVDRYGMYINTGLFQEDGYHYIVLDIEDYLDYCSGQGEEVDILDRDTYRPLSFDTNNTETNYEVMGA